METFWQDLRYSLRTLFKKPGSTFVVVTTLALGFGADATIFTWINILFQAERPQVLEVGAREKTVVQTAAR